MKLRNLILIVTLLFFIISCTKKLESNTKIEVTDTYKATYTSTQLNYKLNSGFEQMNSDSIKHFFTVWNKTIKSNSDEFINQNDTINSVYNVYRVFYKPNDLLKLGDWEWGNDLNSNSIYTLIQNKLFYSVIKTENLDDYNWKKSKIDSINNFRPHINKDPNKVLYLTTEYEEALYSFLGTKSTELGEDNLMDPSKPKDESEKKYETIRPYIPILHGHWSGYWHLETHPEISTIVFNSTMNKAKIFFRVGFQGGEATLFRNGKDWSLYESHATWIE